MHFFVKVIMTVFRDKSINKLVRRKIEENIYYYEVLFVADVGRFIHQSITSELFIEGEMFPVGIL